MKALFLILLSSVAWSQTTIKFVCDQTDILSKKKIPGTALVIEVIEGKAAHLYSGEGAKRELKTSLKFKARELVESALTEKDSVSEIKKIIPEGEAMTYSTRSDRGVEFFLVAKEKAIHGYEIDRGNPAIKAAIEKGASIEDHAFVCNKISP